MLTILSRANLSQIPFYWQAFRSLTLFEIRRFLRIYFQTLAPPVITTTLYFLIFGQIMGKRIGLIDDIPFAAYIAPGLIMMALINSSYGNVSSSYFSNKFQKSLEAILVSPMPHWLILLSFITAGVLRGLLVASMVWFSSLLFTPLLPDSWFNAIALLFLTAVLFSITGLINGLLARSFDDIMLIPTFILTPLIYLGGIFFSVNLFNPVIQKFFYINPIFYIINGIRHAFFTISDIPILIIYAILFVTIGLLLTIALKLMYKQSNDF